MGHLRRSVNRRRFMFAPSIGSHNNIKINEISGDNVVVDAAARDRVAANGLICAYMEIYPYKAWDSDQQIEVWCMEKDDNCDICHEERDLCIKRFCELAKYDTSWEWLMPVVEKIRQEKWNTRKVYFVIHNDYIQCYAGEIVDKTNATIKDGVWRWKDNMNFYFRVDGSGIQSVYEGVVKYLEL